MFQIGVSNPPKRPAAATNDSSSAVKKPKTSTGNSEKKMVEKKEQKPVTVKPQTVKSSSTVKPRADTKGKHQSKDQSKVN